MILLDQRNQQFKNILPNPGFEKAAAATAIERFRNLVKNPRLGNGTSTASGWSVATAGGGTPINSVETTGGPLPECSTWLKSILAGSPTASPGGTSSASQTSAYATAVLPNTRYTLSAYGIVSAALRTGIRLDWSIYDDSNALIVTTSGTGTAAAANTVGAWLRPWKTIVTPANAATIVLKVAFSGPEILQAGDWWGATGFMVTKDSTLMPYFDGATTGNNLASPLGYDYTYSFAGAAHLSESIVSGPTPAVEVYRNLIFNGMARDLTAWGYGGSHTATLSAETSGGPSGLSYCKALVTVPATNSNIAMYCSINSYRVAATSGQVFSIGAWGYQLTGVTVPSSFARITYVDAGNVAVTTINLDSKPLINDTWTRFTGTITVPTDPTIVGFRVDMYFTVSSITVPTNAVFGMSGVIATQTTAAVDYFDGALVWPGSYFDDTDFFPAWIGTANASASVIRGVALPQYLNSASSTVARAIQSFTSSKGKKSMRLIPVSTPDSYYTLAEGLFLFKANRTYSVICTLIQKGALVGTPTTNGSRQIWAISTGGGTGYSARSTQGTNTAGTYQHRLTWTVPDDLSTYRNLRVYNGYSIGAGDVWWDDVMLFEGKYSGSAMDGDTIKGKWLGTAHASTSVVYPSTP